MNNIEKLHEPIKININKNLGRDIKKKELFVKKHQAELLLYVLDKNGYILNNVTLKQLHWFESDDKIVDATTQTNIKNFSGNTDDPTTQTNTKNFTKKNELDETSREYNISIIFYIVCVIVIWIILIAALRNWSECIEKTNSRRTHENQIARNHGYYSVVYTNEQQNTPT